MAPRAKKQICEQCGSTYHNPSDLTAHMIREHGHQPLVCSQLGCNKQFSSPRSLQRHVSEQHGSQQLPCTICGRTFPRKENLKRHEKSCQRKHGGTGRFQVPAAADAAPVAAIAPITPPTPVVQAENPCQWVSTGPEHMYDPHPSWFNWGALTVESTFNPVNNFLGMNNGELVTEEQPQLSNPFGATCLAGQWPE